MTIEYDVLVIGSGFGGSVTALRLTEKGYRVGVLEAGRRYRDQDFPKTNWDVRNFLWAPWIGCRGPQRITPLRDVLVLSMAGVGGGSLIYANTLYEPLGHFYRDRQWAHLTDWQAELAPYYDQAKRMLGAVETTFETAADEVMKEVARRLGVEHTYHRTDVGVFFGEAPGKTVPDPFFGGAGPERAGCIQCGACMVGCRHNAKNTLEKNYLWLAEKNGCVIHPEQQVVDLEPLEGGGFEILAERPGAWVRKRRTRYAAKHVVLSAGVLGTLRLLFELRERGRLPGLSPRLGKLVRTNSEAILGASTRTVVRDYSQGVAITSSIHPDEHTHIEPVRYPAGSNAMGLLQLGLLVDGGDGLPRPLRFLIEALKHPWAVARSFWVHRWSERTVILLVMQSLDNSLNVFRKRGLFGRRKLTTEQGHGAPNPTYIPVANRAARIAAEVIGGDPGSSIAELFDVPMTAHVIGGCAIGESPETGVIDPYQRVFGCPGLSIADGSAVSANLGVNPSLTITAMSERAAAFWPNAGDRDPRPPLGSAYARIAPVAPQNPAVPSGAPGALTGAGAVAFATSTSARGDRA